MDGLAVPMHGFRVLTGTGNEALASEIAEHLGIELCKASVNRFADGEVFVRIDENVRGADVFIVQPTNPPAENILELLLLIDAARRASAARITVRPAVLRLRAAGPQGPAARRHRGQADGPT